MTAILYSDCHSTSDNGRFRLTANSPHNGTINHRDGTAPSEDEFSFKYREHQSEFRYRLLDDRDRILWERWQDEREDSPGGIFVSDQGWSILCTHGFKPEIIVVSPEGRDAIRIKLLAEGDPTEVASTSTLENSDTWRLKHLAFTTAGYFWTSYSWTHFLELDGRTYFAWRASWGQRLVIDLEAHRKLSEIEQAEPVMATKLASNEIAGVRKLLEELSPVMGQVRDLLGSRSESMKAHPLFDKLSSVASAIHLVGFHRIRECIPFLREWEEVDYPSYMTGSTAMSDRWLEAQAFRPLIHHALRRLDEEPAGFPTYHFRVHDKERLPIPERIPDRYDRAQEIDRGMSAVEVLQRIGSPDHVTRESHKEGKFYRWTERWEYDFLLESGWVTKRITWEEHKKAGRIIEIEQAPSEWLLTNEREADILRH